jgi:hypothetical protein
MKMKMATRTSALGLGRVGVERHHDQANEQRVYSSFGESLPTKKKKASSRGQKKCCPILDDLGPSYDMKENKGGGAFAHMR